MGLQIISETAEAVSKHRLSEDEQRFVVTFAFKTNDRKLTNKLIAELVGHETDTKVVMNKYHVMMDQKPDWIGQIENLLVALELYRVEEEKAVNRLADILNAYGIEVTVAEIRVTDANELKERVRKEAVWQKGDYNYAGRDSGSGTDYPCSLRRD